MPLCPQCKSEAEVTKRGPEPTRFERWVSSVFGSGGDDPQHERCSRCGEFCDECDSAPKAILGAQEMF